MMAAVLKQSLDQSAEIRELKNKVAELERRLTAHQERFKQVDKGHVESIAVLGTAITHANK